MELTKDTSPWRWGFETHRDDGNDRKTRILFCMNVINSVSTVIEGKAARGIIIVRGRELVWSFLLEDVNVVLDVHLMVLNPV